MTPLQYCKQKAAQSGSSFTVSFIFLPKMQREAMTALYAFCREVDDVVDECTDFGVAQTKLNWWKSEVANLYAGRNIPSLKPCSHLLVSSVSPKNIF